MEKFYYIVERADHWGQVQIILDRWGAQGYRLAQPLVKVGTKSYQIIMELRNHWDA